MSAPAVTPRVRCAAVGTVLTLAAVAAFMSYGHLRAVAESHGEDAAALFPVSVDGLIVAASLVLLVQRRSGQPGGALPWAGLLLGIAATIAGNIASAEPNAVARLVAAWPPCAFALAYEFLLSLLRPPAPAQGTETEVPAPVPAADQVTEVPLPPAWQVTAVPPPGAVPALSAELPNPAGNHRPVGDPLPTVAARRPVPDPELVPEPELVPAAEPELTDEQLLEQLHGLLEGAGDRAPGRRVLARELGVTEHRIRRLTNGSAPR